MLGASPGNPILPMAMSPSGVRRIAWRSDSAVGEVAWRCRAGRLAIRNLGERCRTAMLDGIARRCGVRGCDVAWRCQAALLRCRQRCRDRSPRCRLRGCSAVWRRPAKQFLEWRCRWRRCGVLRRRWRRRRRARRRRLAMRGPPLWWPATSPGTCAMSPATCVTSPAAG